MSQSDGRGRFLHTLDSHRPHTKPYPEWLSAQELWRDARTAINIVDTIRADLPGLDGWINFPLLNQSGQGGDLRLEAYTGRPVYDRVRE